VDIESLFQEAHRHHQEGRFEVAERLYREILVDSPKHHDSLHHLGLIDLQFGRIHSAIDRIRMSLCIYPQQPVALSNLGHCLYLNGNYEEAIQICSASIDLDAHYHAAWTNLGISQRAMKLFGEASESFGRALALQPSSSISNYNAGLAHFDLGDFKRAEECFERCLAIAPGIPEAHNGLAACLLRRQMPGLALTHIDYALKAMPGYAEAWNNRGNALHELSRQEDALLSFRRAVELEPRYAEAWSNYGSALRSLRRYDEALAAFDRAIELMPDSGVTWSNRGNTLRRLRRHRASVESYERAISFDPESAETWSNYGVELSDLRRDSEADKCFCRAVALKSDCAEAHWNRSNHFLRLGIFDHGWRLYEWRWQLGHFLKQRREFSVPLWLGESDLSGRTILLHAEQGLGDTIQFCRYALDVKRLGANVILEVQRPLLKLLKTLDGVDLIVEKGKDRPLFDYHCPLMSLPLAFQTTLHTIPQHRAYLLDGYDKARVPFKKWFSNKKGPKVGLVWAGNRDHENDLNRSIDFESILNLVSDDFCFISLQRDASPMERTRLEAVGVVASFMPNDFIDTAQIISQLDLLISVDTSVAHLAGALDRPVWVLLPYVPDFRWMWDREDSPWYPSMKLFRQPIEGSWGQLLKMVREELYQYGRSISIKSDVGET